MSPKRASQASRPGQSRSLSKMTDLDPMTDNKSAARSPTSKIAAESDADRARRPGFLIRRLYQIHVALFAEECAAFNITPVQYSIMTAALLNPGMEQSRLAHEAGVDYATLANVVTRLQKRALLRRIKSTTDKRIRGIVLTSRGEKVVESVHDLASQAGNRAIGALSPEERKTFIDLMFRLVEAGNSYGRAPLRLDPRQAADKPVRRSGGQRARSRRRA